MSNSRWKVMACSLGLSLGGLAIVAGPMNNRLNAQYEPRTIEKSASPAPTLPEPAIYPAEKLAGVPDAPETVAPRALEITLPVAGEPGIVLPVAGFDAAPAYPSDRGGELLPAPRPTDEKFEVFTETVVTSPVPVAPPPVSPNPPATELPVPASAPMANLPPVQPLPPNAFPSAVQSQPVPIQPSMQQIAASHSTAKLKMLMRLGDGKPRFEIRNSDSADLLLKVYGEKVEMQQAPEEMRNSPIAGVTATGQVRFIGAGVEGTCDQLSVLSGTGEVLLKGNVCIKTGAKGKTVSEVKAEKMIYQIGVNGLTTASSGGVRPASYTRP